MFLSSIDFSYFALPLVFQEMGLFFGIGFFFYLLFLSLMASQCYIELKWFSIILRGSNRTSVGLIDLVEECCRPASNSIHNPCILILSEVYLKFVIMSTLVLLLASNQAFVTIVLQKLLSDLAVGCQLTLDLDQAKLIIPLFAFVWLFTPLFKH